MDRLRYTLLSDGSSNKALLPIITWLLHQHLQNVAIQGEWSDLRRLRKPPPRSDIPERIRLSIDLYPCDLFFIHRDAEGAHPDQRVREITEAVQTARANNIQVPPTISVVPVRMLESWLLFDINAIRMVAGNPNGIQPLNLPPLNDIENLPDPKEILRRMLRDASELSGRRLSRFNSHSALLRIPELIDDFGQLRNLTAFQKLESDITQTISSCGWR
jgi:hypothetical protein